MKIIRHEIRFGLKQKITVFAFYILMAIVFVNFATNVFAFQGLDRVEMYHPAKILSISFNRIYSDADMTLLLVQLYPVLVVCPAGFMLLSEKTRKENILIITKIGSTKYYLCKMVAAFFITAIVFTVPFLIELLLNCISFPVAATGDFTGLNQYNPTYVEMVTNYTMSGLYEWDSYLYAIIEIFVFGIFSGIMGAFTVSLSSVLTIRYKIFLFLPIFILLNASVYISYITDKLSYSVRWFDYVLLFNDSPKNMSCFICILLALILISIACILYKSKGDQF